MNILHDVDRNDGVVTKEQGVYYLEMLYSPGDGQALYSRVESQAIPFVSYSFFFILYIYRRLAASAHVSFCFLYIHI